MAIALEIRRGDVVTFTPDPALFTDLLEVSQLEVYFLYIDPELVLMTFIVNDVSRQVFLTHAHPVTIDIKQQTTYDFPFSLPKERT